MSKGKEREATGWRDLPASLSKIEWLAQDDGDLFESEGVVCNLGFDQHFIVKDSAGNRETFGALNNDMKINSMIQLMELSFANDESEYRTRAGLSDEIRFLLSQKNAFQVCTPPGHSPILTQVHMQDNDVLLKSTSTERAHHSREKEPNEEHSENPTNGAPSPESLLSYDFPNDSSYSLRQLDCQSDLTEGTNGLSLAPFGSNIGNPPCGPRSRGFSVGDASLNGLASAEAWDPNETLSTQSNHERDAQEEFDEQSVQGLLPELAAEDTAFENTLHPAVLHLHDLHSTSNINTINKIHTSQATHHNTRSPVLSTVLECSGTSEFSRTSALGTRDTFSATAASPISPDTMFGEAVNEQVTNQANHIIGTLVLPTVLSGAAKGTVLEVLAQQGAEVKQVRSSAVALVTSYLTTEEAKDNLIRNAGCLRLLVLEAAAGIVIAAVVSVECSLQSDLPGVNTASSTETNISINTSSSSNIANTSSTSSSVHPATPANSVSSVDSAEASSYTNSSSSSGGSHISSDASDSDASKNSYSSENNSPDSPDDTGGSSNKTNNTTESTPVGMQESTYVLSDSAYAPTTSTASVQSGTEVVPECKTQDGDAVLEGLVDTVHTTSSVSNNIPASSSEDSADYNNNSNINLSNNSPTISTNDYNNNISNDNPTPTTVPPLARSAVVRVECAVWSHYTINNNNHDDATKAEPLQDPSITKISSNSDVAAPPSTSDLQSEMASCIKMALAQQSSMHNPFQPIHTPTTTAATSPPDTIPRRHASYHSLELDQRLFGLSTAAALHDLEATANRMDLKNRSGGDSIEIEKMDIPVPVPVLDGVLLWSSVNNPTTHATTECEHALLDAVRTVVQPHLRDPTDHLTAMGMADSAASQVTMEGSYIALSPLTMQMKQQVCDSAIQKSTTSTATTPSPILPLYTVPYAALQQGSCILQSLPCDVLRVYECKSVAVLQGGTVVMDTLAVGLVVRRVSSSNATSNVTTSDTTPSIGPDEEIIWLYNPITAAATSANPATGRMDRECSLLLTATSDPTPTPTIDSLSTTVTITAHPCTVSRRSCPLKPTVSVHSFVQQPPLDTACVVLPSTATYRSDTFLPGPSVVAREYRSGSVREKTDIGALNSNSGEVEGVRKGNLFFPNTESEPVLPAAALIPNENGSILTTIVNMYALLCNRLHCLIFPGSTYYIQYYQADVCESTSIDNSGTCSTGRTPGIQTVTVPTPTPNPTTSTSHSTDIPLARDGQWELLIVTQPLLDCGTKQNMRILNTIQLPTTPTYCEQLIAQEDSTCATTTVDAADAHVFPPCLVSLSAVDETGLRSIVAKPMTGPDPKSTPTSVVTPTPTTASGRRKKQPTIKKQHYIELTPSSHQLLAFREQQHRKIRTVRNVLKYICVGVLSVMTILLLVVLLEVMWMQRNYAARDVATPVGSTSVSETPHAAKLDTTTTTATPLDTRPVPRFPTTSSTYHKSTTSRTKTSDQTNPVYYHVCKMNPVDPLLPAIYTTYVVNEVTSELTEVVGDNNDEVLRQHVGNRESGVLETERKDREAAQEEREQKLVSEEETCPANEFVGDIAAGTDTSCDSSDPTVSTAIADADSNLQSPPSATSIPAPQPAEPADFSLSPDAEEGHAAPQTVPVTQHDCATITTSIIPDSICLEASAHPSQVDQEASQIPVVQTSEQVVDGGGEDQQDMQQEEFLQQHQEYHSNEQRDRPLGDLTEYYRLLDSILEQREVVLDVYEAVMDEAVDVLFRALEILERVLNESLPMDTLYTVHSQLQSIQDTIASLSAEAFDETLALVGSELETLISLGALEDEHNQYYLKYKQQDAQLVKYYAHRLADLSRSARKAQMVVELMLANKQKLFSAVPEETVPFDSGTLHVHEQKPSVLADDVDSVDHLMQLDTEEIATTTVTISTTIPNTITATTTVSATTTVYTTDTTDTSTPELGTATVSAMLRIARPAVRAGKIKREICIPVLPDSVRQLVHAVVPVCRDYLKQCQRYVQHYYHWSTEYVRMQQQHFSAWSRRTARTAQSALQHAAFTITTSPLSKALQHYYRSLYNTIAHTIHTYYPIVHDRLHIDELAAWTEEKIAIVQEDLHTLYEVSHVKALSRWLHTHSTSLSKRIRARRRATLKTQQELLQQGQQVWHTVVDTTAQYARDLQRAVRSASVRAGAAVRELSQQTGKTLRAMGTNGYTEVLHVVDVCRLWSTQVLLSVQRAMNEIVTKLTQMRYHVVSK